MRLNKALVRPVHKGPTLNGIFPKCTNLILTDTSSRYHNLKLHKKSHITTFAYQFGRYRYVRLLFGPAPGGDTFKCKTDEIFKEMLNVFGIADDILSVGWDVGGEVQERMPR